MKLTSISQQFFQLCAFDRELLANDNRRPYLVILRLRYKGQRQDFAVPFRSNISNYVPKNQYYSLPPRHSTKENKIHGLHYLKMFPVRKRYLNKFHVDRDPYYVTILKVMEDNRKTIINEAQAYVSAYEKGQRIPYCTDIDGIIAALDAADAVQEREVIEV